MKPTEAFRPPKEKKCGGCKKVKPLSSFDRNSDLPDGRVNKCRDCLKEIEAKKKVFKTEYAKTFFVHDKYYS